MNKEEFKEKLRQGVGRVLDTSKKALGKAGVAMQDFSDKSVIKIEKRQMENKRSQEYEKIGRFVAEKFMENPDASVSGTDEFISEVLKEIGHYNTEIENREKVLAEERGKDE